MTSTGSPLRYEIGVDIGGTFTDVVCREQRRGGASGQDPDHPQQPQRRRAAASWRLGVSTADHPVRAWHDGRDQCRARAQGRPYRPAHHRRVSGRAGDRPADAPPDVRSVLKPETPVFLAPRRYRKEVASASTRNGVVWSRSTRRPSPARRTSSWPRRRGHRGRLLFSFLNPAHEERIARSSRRATRGSGVALARGRSGVSRI